MANLETAQPQPQSNPSAWWQIPSKSLQLNIAVSAILSFVLLFTNLSSYPQPWIDEGYLIATARTLADQGYYTPVSGANVPEFDPTISTGPTAIVPIAIIYKLAGVGILPARILIALSAILVLLAIGALATRLHGLQSVPLLILLILAGTPDSYMSFVPMSRQVLGEVSAIGFCIYGMWLWIRACDHGGWVWWRFCIAGCSLGLALITKPQMVMAIPPACLLIVLADRSFYRIAPWRAWVWTGLGATVIVVGWFWIQASVIGFDTLLRYYLGSNSNLRAEVLNDTTRYLRRALGSLWRAGFLWWGLPGIIYGSMLARQKSREGLMHAWLLLIWGCWTFWMLGFSVGWSRYAFLSVLLPLFWSAELITALIPRMPPIQRMAAMTLVACGIGVNLYHTAYPIFSTQNNDAEQFAAYLRTTIPHTSTIYSWEWELEILAPHQFEYPTPKKWYDIVDLVQSDTPIPSDFVDSNILSADYIIDGPFSSWTTIFRRYIEAHTTRVTQVGLYTLYEVNR